MGLSFTPTKLKISNDSFLGLLTIAWGWEKNLETESKKRTSFIKCKILYIFSEHPEKKKKN
jgi:hypothetical protein